MEPLSALPYHRAVVAHLQTACPRLWRSFAADTARSAAADAARLELLKSTYALTAASHGPVLDLARRVADALGITVPIAIHQGSDGTMNARLVFLPEQAAIVLDGPILSRLAEDELAAVLAHELAHHLLWQLEGGVYLCADRVLDALAAAEPASSAVATQRLYALTTELFADRAALRVGGVDPAVRCLVKVNTGADQVSSADFLDQARRSLEAFGSGSEAWTHPETYLRALALDAFARDPSGSDALIATWLEGRMPLKGLDLPRRAALEAWTRRLVDTLLAPSWMRTEAVLGLARRWFDDYQVGEASEAEDLAAGLSPFDDSVRDYGAFVLLDFSVADPTLGDAAFARAHLVAEAIGLHERLEGEAQRKLKRSKKLVALAVAERDATLRRVETLGAP